MASPPAGTSDEPQKPPEISAPARLAAWQWVGIGVMVAVVVPALFGLLSSATSDVRSEGGGLELSVTYPARLNYKTIEPLIVRLRNTGGNSTGPITVLLDPEYMHGLSNVQFTPQPIRPNTFELDGIAPGQEAIIVGEVQGEEYGSHKGRVAVTAESGSVSAELRTFVFP